ncbi:hypothetical protein ACTOB_000477 [Actinoplanes oblitus]|uniref:SWIM-type domain-containing protein n=1 Tax=Actinoplanes oblitus TaxID=3040509 RepID=A0ABY8WSX3_9ACTN|nr:hypothetical protein [Actinoplanes oblitus]WIN01032.1 hypothetical protein ACTOB_000477 [Actinoplanes oblitus]
MMAKLILSPEETVLCEAVGVHAFLRARAVAADGEIVVQAVGTSGQAVGKVRDGGVVSGEVVSGATPTLTGVCTCADLDCVHIAALLIAARQATAPKKSAAPAQRRPRASRWESQLSAWMRDVAGPPLPQPAEPGLGLQFELVSGYLPRSRRTGQRISMRPVLPGRKGWVRTGINWYSITYAGGHSPDLEHHRRLLNEIIKLSGSYTPYYGSGSTNLFLDEFGSRRIWDLLAEAQDCGLPLVQYGKNAAPVIVARRPAPVSLQVDRVDGDLSLQAVMQVDGTPVDVEHAMFIGEPAHGIASWSAEAGQTLRLAPLARPLPKSARKVLTAPSIRIPGGQEERFFAEFYPGLVRQLDVVPAGPDVSLPDVGAPALTVTLTAERGHQLRLRWEWVVTVGGGRYTEPLWSPTFSDEQAELVRKVSDLVGSGPLESSLTSPRLAAESVLSGDAMIHFLATVAPALVEVGVAVVEPAGDWDLRESEAAPVITFANAEQTDEHDWFDLSVRVEVGGERVDFETLFVALARDQEFLILPGGTYFALDRPGFRQLRELIAESRALTDSPPGVLRVLPPPDRTRARPGPARPVAPPDPAAGAAPPQERGRRRTTAQTRTDRRGRPVPGTPQDLPAVPAARTAEGTWPARRPGEEQVRDLPLAHPAAPGQPGRRTGRRTAPDSFVDETRPARRAAHRHRHGRPPHPGLQPVHPLPGRRPRPVGTCRHRLRLPGRHHP